ncbi:hypothetical protein B7463_g12283, partial [Scytalidium lignicola]
MQPSQPVTPVKERLLEAKQWLIDNPQESQSVAAKIFKVNQSTLAMSIQREKRRPKQRESQNKMLTASQEQAVHSFIKLYLENRQAPTKEIVFGAICKIRKNHGDSPPSKSWFTEWWTGQPGLHKIKTKAMAQNRITAQDEDDIQVWFQKYRTALEKYEIEQHNLYNFDKWLSDWVPQRSGSARSNCWLVRQS